MIKFNVIIQIELVKFLTDFCEFGRVYNVRKLVNVRAHP